MRGFRALGANTRVLVRSTQEFEGGVSPQLPYLARCVAGVHEKGFRMHAPGWVPEGRILQVQSQTLLPQLPIRSERVRCNVSFDKLLLTRVDAAARRYDLTRSALLEFCFNYVDATMGLSATSSAENSGDEK